MRFVIIRTAVALLAMTVLAAAQTTPPTAPVAPAAKPEISNAAKAFAKIAGGDGVWWRALSEEEKDSFIYGYTDAMRHATTHTDAFCDDGKKTLQPGPGFNEQMKLIMTLCFLAQEFNFKAAAPLKPRLDEFYKDPLNARIPDFMAMQHVRDEMTGRKTAGQLLDELNDWRKTMNGDSSKPAK